MVDGHDAGDRAEHVDRDPKRLPVVCGIGPGRVHAREPAELREPAGGDRVRRPGGGCQHIRRAGCGLAGLCLCAAYGDLVPRPEAEAQPCGGRHRSAVPYGWSENMSTAPTETRARSGVEVRLEELRKVYSGVTALDGLSLTIGQGELVALLGSSGCGKTTALRLLAGLEEADGGRVVIGGKDVTDVPANKRQIGMVFQAYSLFPHMTAMQNVEFGMQLHDVDAPERRKRAGEMLDLVGLSGHTHKYAVQLSGGQQQRVALARALAIEPKVLLLDEPLSALDAKVRSRLRDEIRRVQLEVGITTLFVTHDQEEALAIADRVGVMNAGHIEQLGPPTAIYSRPATSFVAEFVGLTNRLAGIVKGGEVEVRGTRLPLVKPDSTEGPAIALVRPEAVSVVSDGDMSPGPLTGSVISTVFLGATSRVSVDLGDVTVLAQLPTSAVGAITAGTKVRLSLRTDPVLIARDEKAATEA